MGLWESALILLGVGIISSKFKAGLGLGELGTGIELLSGAPLRGVGGGLGAMGTGMRSFAESLGDIGRGIGDLFAFIPKFPDYKGAVPGIPDIAGPFAAKPPLIQTGGGSSTQLLAGGGGNVPVNGQLWRGGPYIRAPTPSNGTGLELRYKILRGRGIGVEDKSTNV